MPVTSEDLLILLTCRIFSKRRIISLKYHKQGIQVKVKNSKSGISKNSQTKEFKENADRSCTYYKYLSLLINTFGIPRLLKKILHSKALSHKETIK